MVRNPIKAEDLPYIRNIRPGQRWYNEAKDGAIILPKVRIARARVMISDQAAVALALNELCAERKRGKVYFFYTPWHRAQAAREPDARLREAQELPDLLYVPEVWTEQEQTEWGQYMGDELLFRCSARGGWVPEEMPVLPISCEVWAEETTVPYVRADTRAKVTLLLSPKPYVGPTKDMAAKLPVKGLYGLRKRPFYTMQSIGWKRMAETWGPLEDYKADGGMDILDRLDKMYWSKKTDYLDLYRVLVEELSANWREESAQAGVDLVNLSIQPSSQPLTS